MFLDGERKRWAGIARRYFNPHQRTMLEELMGYCRADAGALMVRLQAVFPRALHELTAKRHTAFQGD